LNASASRADVKVVRLEEYLRDRAGILAAHGVGMYQFPHRTFQEYLAACYLTDDDFPEKLAELARNDPNRWREVALLAGAKAARGSSLNAWALSESLCLSPPPDGPAPAVDHWGALLAGRVLVECADLTQVAPRNRDKLERVREWQRAIVRRNTLPATERALAGRTLAVLGDPRPDVTSLDGMHFCFVPLGPCRQAPERQLGDVGDLVVGGNGARLDPIEVGVEGDEAVVARIGVAVTGERNHRGRITAGTGFGPSLPPLQLRHDAASYGAFAGLHPDAFGGVAAPIRVDEQVAQSGNIVATSVAQHPTQHSGSTTMRST
jgi:hypothetical protein